MYGTRELENQVKMLSSRMAHKEGHSADLIADAISRIVLAVRFRCGGEPHVQSVHKIMDSAVEGDGEEAVKGCIVTADRGYGKDSFLNMMSNCGIGSVFVMLEHFLKVYPFVEK